MLRELLRLPNNIIASNQTLSHNAALPRLKRKQPEM